MVNFGYYFHGSLIVLLPLFHLERLQQRSRVYNSLYNVHSILTRTRDVNATINECAHKIVETKVSKACRMSLFTFRKIVVYFSTYLYLRIYSIYLNYEPNIRMYKYRYTLLYMLYACLLQ